MNQHTPGPWKTTKDGRVFSGSAKEWNRTFNAEMPTFIAACGGNDANARLIAQAPEMLAILRNVILTAEDHGVGHWPPVDDARAIIRAAEGPNA